MPHFPRPWVLRVPPFLWLKGGAILVEYPEKPWKIKGNRHSEDLSTASKPHVVLPSSPRDKFYQNMSKTPGNQGSRGFSFGYGLKGFLKMRPILTSFLWVNSKVIFCFFWSGPKVSFRCHCLLNLFWYSLTIFDLKKKILLSISVNSRRTVEKHGPTQMGWPMLW